MLAYRGNGVLMGLGCPVCWLAGLRRLSLSPHEHGERAGVRGAFHLIEHQSPFAPSAREARCVEGPSTQLPPIVIPAQANPVFAVILSVAKDLASQL